MNKLSHIEWTEFLHLLLFVIMQFEDKWAVCFMTEAVCCSDVLYERQMGCCSNTCCTAERQTGCGNILYWGQKSCVAIETCVEQRTNQLCAALCVLRKKYKNKTAVAATCVRAHRWAATSNTSLCLAFSNLIAITSHAAFYLETWFFWV